jgi:hypothetical protein
MKLERFFWGVAMLGAVVGALILVVTLGSAKGARAHAANGRRLDLATVDFKAQDSHV